MREVKLYTPYDRPKRVGERVDHTLHEKLERENYATKAQRIRAILGAGELRRSQLASLYARYDIKPQKEKIDSEAIKEAINVAFDDVTKNCEFDYVDAQNAIGYLQERISLAEKEKSLQKDVSGEQKEVADATGNQNSQNANVQSSESEGVAKE